MLIEKHQPQVLINSRIGGGYGHFETAVDNGLMPCVNTNWKDGRKFHEILVFLVYGDTHHI